MRTLFFVVTAPFFCLAQVPAPVISFDETEHDFGKMSDDDQPVSHRFKVTNKGDAPLRIKEIITSCGCTHAVVGKWLLGPGEETFVEAHFNPAGLHGSVQKTLSVISNDPAKAVTYLTIKASLMRDIIESAPTVYFNEVPRNGPVMSETIRLQSGNGQPVCVTDARIPDAPYLSCAPQGDGDDVILNISIDGRLIPKESQRGDNKLTVFTTSQKMPELRFSIGWSVQEVIAAAPKRINWFNPVGKELRTVLRLSHIKGRPFRILGVKSSSHLITVSGLTEDNEENKDGAAEHKLEVVMSAKAKVGSYNETLILSLNDPEQQTIQIVVTAILR